MIRLIRGSLSLPRADRVFHKTSCLRYCLLRNFPRYQSNVVEIPKIKFESVPKQPDIDKLLENPELQHKYLSSMGNTSPSQQNSTYTIFLNAIDMASGRFSAEAYEFVLRMWEIVFSRGFPDQNLQKQLVQTKLKIVHLIMNNGDYSEYERLIRPVYTMGHLEAKPAWADKLASTFQFTKDAGKLRYSRQLILTFFRGKETIEQKRKLISVFLRKLMLYSDSPDVFPLTLRDLILFLDAIEDGHLLLTSKEHKVYEKSLRLLVSSQSQLVSDRLDQIAETVMDVTESKHLLLNFITTLLGAIHHSDPKAAIMLWNYKLEKLNSNVLEYRNSQDMKHVMWAHFNLRNYESVMKVHSENPNLHEDDQIEVLLRIAEQTKDWKLLQKQFEDMYGQNQLPHVIHYSIVMNALASLGVLKEVEQLYEQLRKRNLQPSAGIFSALIRANHIAGKKEKATEWYNDVLTNAEKYKIEPEQIAKLQTEILQAGFVDSNVESTVLTFKNLFDLQEKSGRLFVNSDMVFRILKFLSSVYRKKEFDEVHELAKQFNLLSEPVYCQLISSLTQFGEYEKSEEIAFLAQQDSPVPFQSATVTRAQLRNYRAWFKLTANRDIRRFLAARTTAIIKRADNRQFSPQNIEVLYAEIIKHFVSLQKLKAATSYFERTRQLSALSEEHYLPFLKHYARLGTYEGYAQILEKYREMAKLKIPMSARSYVYLIKALLHMDKVNHTGFDNSYKLLESVFELYGFSPAENIAGNNVLLADLVQNSPDLLRIVSEFSVATSGQLDKGMRIAVRLLSDIKEKLGKNIGFDLRMAIFQEMSKIYLARGDKITASELLDNAMGELNKILDLNDGKLDSKLFQINYRHLVALKLQTLGGSSEDSGYAHILEETLKRNVRLAGLQYGELCEGAIQEPKSFEFQNSSKPLRLALQACESYLVSGNWAEVKIRRTIHTTYKVFMVYLSRTLSPETIEESYSLLNHYYNVVDLAELQNEYASIQDPLSALSAELDSFNALNANETWAASTLLRNLPEFFVPERSIPTKNTIKPALAAKLLKSIETHCQGDQNAAFSLYDDFPETMEYLLYFRDERTRLVLFRKAIDRLSPPTRSAHAEDRNSRRERAVQALKHLSITTTDIDSI